MRHRFRSDCEPILPRIQPPASPTNLHASRGALPARFRRERVLVVGCGDVGSRTARLLRGRANLIALTSTAQRVAGLRAQGLRVLQGNLDAPASLRRLAGVATRVLHLAPPPSDGPGAQSRDPRTAALVAALRMRTVPRVLVYGSTTGVYGDCAGAWVDESRTLAARTPRALRRCDAESHVRLWTRASVRTAAGAVRTSILRIPGIYANDRAGGTPRERLMRGMPVLRAQDDVYTNHVHADDLARACLRALWRPAARRVVNVCDDSDLRMGDYYDFAADLYGLPRPPRVTREEAELVLPPMTLSFMGESRRLRNNRMKRELGLRLRYPTVREGLRPPTA